MKKSIDSQPRKSYSLPDMKTNIATTLGIIIAAIAHITPAASILMIALGNEPIRAIGAGTCLASSLLLGYIHGKNGSLG